MVNSSSNCTWSSKDKTKEWQMEMLMEKLRSKANQYRSFQQCAKDLRMALLEKRYPIDSSERIQLQKCLDTLQQNIKVTTHQAMVERLESVSRQLGLKLVRPTPSGLEIFISSDMFYLEIVLESNGGVKDVKIHHEGRGEQSCEELVTCLSERNFADFTAQLEGLASIYQLNAEKKVKCKAFSALTSLEADLTTLASLHYIKDLVSVVHNSPVGLLEKRKGGHPMKLTYFVSPYDLLDPVTRTSREVTAETLNNVGQSVSVCMESSSAHKLQTSPIVTITRTPDGNNWPVYGGLSASNSITVTGSFVLTLKRPIPVCLALITGITAATGADCADISSPHPLLSLVTQVSSGGKTDSADNRGLFVNVGDQHHCYLMTEARGLDGVLVSSIPFTHPSHVPQVLACLRQQALFNTVIASCVRPSTPQDIEKMIMLEVMPLDWQHLSVTLEHPLEESMATVELDLTDVNNLTCKVYTSSGENTQANSEYATKVFQRSMSIPVTMRSLIKLWNAQGQRMAGIYNGGGIGDSGGGGGGSQPHPSSDFDPDIKIKLEPGLGGLVSRHGSFTSDQADPGFDQFSSSIDSLQFQELGQSLGLLEGKAKRKKRQTGDSWHSPKRVRDDNAETSSSDSSPLGTPNSVQESTPNLELTTINDLENSMSEKPREDLEIGEAMSVSELDVEEMFKSTVSKKPKKNREEKKSSSDILFDLGNKNLVPPSVSITPISSSQMNQNLNSVLSGMGLERRPGIEIIPISSTPTTSVPSLITITPISSKAVPEDRIKERKSSKSRDEKMKLEKKRKRKKEDSPMGPPEKVPPKSDPLSKPVSVSIKPAESSSPRPSSPAGSMRKYSTSPTHTSPLTVGKSSPSPSSKSKQPTPSPKHSPHYSTSSPKNSLSSSPKHSTSSPKHQSSLGKPSMSALKSAVSSPSKSDSKSKSKESRDKDRKVFSSSSGHSSPKMKSSSVKLKQLDITTMEGPQPLQSGGSTPPSSGDGGKPSSSSGQTRNRKGSLSAIVDKLKSQHSDDGNGKEKKDKDRQASSKVEGKSTGKPGENKPSEYMVKPSSDGIKLTINKTKSKDSTKVKSSSSSSSSSSSPSGSGSPKTHTGLKPGVNSGPASKKTTHVSQKSNSPIPRSSSSSSSSSKSANKSSLNMQKSSKPSGSPKMSDPNRVRDKPRMPKLSSFSGKNESRKLSPSPLREDDNYKQLLGEGLVKQLDTKFQIPKLSARSSNPDDKKDKSERSELKDLDYANKIVAGSKNSEDIRVSLVDSKSKLSSSTTISLESSSPKLGPVKIESESPNISIIPMTSSSEKEPFEESVFSSLKLELPMSSLSFSACDLEDKKKIRLPQPCTSEEAAEMLIDFSTPKENKLLPSYPASPSVSVHIMKSPVPPDRPHISPLSSPGITDDELMDEALVGIGGK